MTLPFQTDLLAAPDEVWSVTRLTLAAKRVVEEFPPLWVRGEVLECKAWKSGHWYFKLRDANSQVSCCMWQRYAVRAGKPPADGTEVFVLGKPSLYEAKGEFQLSVTRMLPTAGIGQTQRELERVKARLHQDGLFDPGRKRSLPPMAGTIAVVTSTDGAALRDIITVAARRWPSARLLVVDARVQGGNAVDALVRALGLVNRLAEVDCCIVGRGGGGREDLSAFNAEAVCRALAAVRVPTISAVGHETDISLTDLVADVRAATPSAAAEMALADARAVGRTLDDLGTRLGGALAGRTRLGIERVERAGDRLEAAIAAALQRRHHAVARLSAQLDALSPLRVLERGYALPTGADGRVLKRRADFPPDTSFSLRVADGTVDARVETPSA
jgi:exodeoxyribonuclease VII large subunit